MVTKFLKNIVSFKAVVDYKIVKSIFSHTYTYHIMFSVLGTLFTRTKQFLEDH